jgi:BAI1-associated protein 3
MCRDFDQAETVREKLSKVPAVKGLRGVRKLVKEIAVTVSTGKHDNELIGTATVSLKVLTNFSTRMIYHF